MPELEREIKYVQNGPEGVQVIYLRTCSCMQYKWLAPLNPTLFDALIISDHIDKTDMYTPNSKGCSAL